MDLLSSTTPLLAIILSLIALLQLISATIGGFWSPRDLFARSQGTSPLSVTSTRQSGIARVIRNLGSELLLLGFAGVGLVLLWLGFATPTTQLPLLERPTANVFFLTISDRLLYDVGAATAHGVLTMLGVATQMAVFILQWRPRTRHRPFQALLLVVVSLVVLGWNVAQWPPLFLVVAMSIIAYRLGGAFNTLIFPARRLHLDNPDPLVVAVDNIVMGAILALLVAGYSFHSSVVDITFIFLAIVCLDNATIGLVTLRKPGAARSIAETQKHSRWRAFLLAPPIFALGMVLGTFGYPPHWSVSSSIILETFTGAALYLIFNPFLAHLSYRVREQLRLTTGVQYEESHLRDELVVYKRQNDRLQKYIALLVERLKHPQQYAAEPFNPDVWSVPPPLPAPNVRPAPILDPPFSIPGLLMLASIIGFHILNDDLSVHATFLGQATPLLFTTIGPIVTVFFNANLHRLFKTQAEYDDLRAKFLPLIEMIQLFTALFAVLTSLVNNTQSTVFIPSGSQINTLVHQLAWEILLLLAVPIRLLLVSRLYVAEQKEARRQPVPAEAAVTVIRKR